MRARLDHRVLALGCALALGACGRDVPGSSTLAAAFAAEGVEGAMVVLVVPDETLLVHDPERSARRVLPASTFKIVNALIALETGVATGPDFALPWDGVAREIAAWNQDHTLASAFTASAVWYFQELARRIGDARMAAWVERLGYGNRDSAGPIDRFWLDGALAISPREQVGFLRRLNEGRLPVSARTRELVRELMVLERDDRHTLRGKTGWARGPGIDEHAWLVGWAEVGARTIYFATLVDRAPPGRMGPSRRKVTERALAGLGYLAR